MTSPFVGEIRMFGGTFAPVDWAFCNGQLLPIAEFEALFALIGTTYGGDGQSTFALPDLRGRLPVHQGPGYLTGQTGGAENVQLTANHLPAHTHTLYASTDSANAGSPQGNVASATLNATIYYSSPPLAAMSPAAITSVPGGGQAHDNCQPFLCVNFIIALNGIF